MSLLKRLVWWITKPLRRYLQFRFKVAIMKDIAIEEKILKARKPHWNDKMIKERARKKYFIELRRIGLA